MKFTNPTRHSGDYGRLVAWRIGPIVICMHTNREVIFRHLLDTGPQQLAAQILKASTDNSIAFVSLVGDRVVVSSQPIEKWRDLIESPATAWPSLATT